MALRKSTILLATALLGGCEALPWQDSETSQTAPSPSATDSGEEVSAPARSSPESPGPKKPVSPLNPDELVGLSEEEMLGQLGPPLDVRREAPATVWNYQRANCELKLYFYPSLRDRRLQALTYEVVPSGDTTMENCLQELGSYRNG